MEHYTDMSPDRVRAIADQLRAMTDRELVDRFGSLSVVARRWDPDTDPRMYDLSHVWEELASDELLRRLSDRW